MIGHWIAPLAVGAVVIAGACSGSGSRSIAEPADADVSRSALNMGGWRGETRTNALSQVHGAGAASEVTPETAEIWVGPSGVVLHMTSGAMQGMQLHCSDTTLMSCQVNDGPIGSISGELISQLRGIYSYAGHFKVLHVSSDGSMYSSEHVAHTALDDTTVSLPQGTVTYDGRFAAGVSLSNGTNGIATGNVSLIANFNTAVLSGQMAGAVSHGGASTPVSASFNHVGIHTASGTFAAGPDTVFVFQGTLASGDMSGGFHGPSANEATGVFQIGNEQGGMTGIMLGCSNGVNCIQ